MAATPLNIEEFAANDSLMVDQMLEPIIMGPGGLIRTGTLVLGRVTNEKLYESVVGPT